MHKIDLVYIVEDVSSVTAILSSIPVKGFMSVDVHNDYEPPQIEDRENRQESEENDTSISP